MLSRGRMRSNICRKLHLLVNIKTHLTNVAYIPIIVRAELIFIMIAVIAGRTILFYFTIVIEKYSSQA